MKALSKANDPQFTSYTKWMVIACVTIAFLGAYGFWMMVAKIVNAIWG